MNILSNPFDEAEKLTRERGEWAVGIIETRVFWPQKKQVVQFDGKAIVLLPVEKANDATAPTLPAIAIRAHTAARHKGREAVMRTTGTITAWSDKTKATDPFDLTNNPKIIEAQLREVSKEPLINCS